MNLPATNLLLIVLGILIFLGVLFIWAIHSNVDKTILTAIIAGSATVLAAVLVAAVNQHNTTIRELEEAHRVPKSEAYDEVGLLVTEMFQVTKITEEEAKIRHMAGLEDRYRSVSRKLILWGSSDALEEWLRFKIKAKEVELNPSTRASAELLLHLDDIFRAIREDLGLSNRGVKRGGFVKTFLSNPEDLDRMLKGESVP